MKIKFDSHPIEILWLCITSIMVMYFMTTTFLANGLENNMWIITFYGIITILIMVGKIIKIDSEDKE